MPLQKFTVSRDDSIYHAWPDVVLCDSGKLICTFTECNAHGDRSNSRIVCVESYDRGRTWTSKRPLTEVTTANDNYNCSRISKMPDGRLVRICDRVYGKEMKGTKNEIYLWFSSDEGKTWTDPILTPAEGIVPDKYNVLKSGRHMILAHRVSDMGKLQQCMWYSDDEGKSWSDCIVIAADENLNICEASLLETPNGELVVYMRENSGRGIDCLKVISTDNGNTWSEICNVPVPACHRPVVGYLKSGKVLMTYRFMQGGKGWLGSWTQNVFAAFLDPDQVLETKRSAQSARIVPLDFDRSPKSDLGYTGWVQFDDGEIYVVTYIVDDAPKAQIRGYSFREEDFLLK